jgi:hypothetical protein
VPSKSKIAAVSGPGFEALISAMSFEKFKGCP